MHERLMPAVGAIAVLAGTSAAQALPVAPQIGKPAGEIVQVRGFCGLGWHRGFYGECVPNGVPYAYGPYAGYWPPAARCWWVGTAYGPRQVCAW